MVFAALAVILLLSTFNPILILVAEAKSTEYLYLQVTGKSMEPTLTEGSVVKVKLRVDPESIEVGDIIVYCTIVTGNPRPEGRCGLAIASSRSILRMVNMSSGRRETTVPRPTHGQFLNAFSWQLLLK